MYNILFYIIIALLIMTNPQILDEEEKNAITTLTVYEKEGIELLDTVKTLEIVTADDVAVASELLKKCNALEKKIDEDRKWITDPINKIITNLIAKAKEIMQPATQAKDLIKQKVLEYNQKMEKIRQEQAEKLRQEQLEAQRKLDEAEAQRKAEEEAKRKEEEERLKNLENPEDLKQIEEDRIQRDFEAQKQKAIDEAEAKRIADEAKMKEEALKMNASVWKPKWLYTVKLFEIEDANLVPRAFCTPDESKIREALKTEVAEIPGVRIWTEQRVK